MAHDNEGSAGAAEEPAETRELAKVIEPDGRTVVLTEHAWLHIINEHRGMERYRRAIMETITHPDDRQTMSDPGGSATSPRTRCLRGGCASWLTSIGIPAKW